MKYFLDNRLIKSDNYKTRKYAKPNDIISVCGIMYKIKSIEKQVITLTAI